MAAPILRYLLRSYCDRPGDAQQSAAPVLEPTLTRYDGLAPAEDPRTTANQLNSQSRLGVQSVKTCGAISTRTLLSTVLLY